MLAFVLFLVLVWVVLAVIGAVVKGLIWLTIIAVVAFIATVFLFGSRIGSRRAKS